MSTVLLVAPASDYSRQIASALTSLGHRVVQVNDRVDYSLPAIARSWRWLWRIIRRIPFLRRRSNQALQRTIVHSVSREQPELLLATKGMNIRPQTLAELRRRGVRTAVWFPDNAANEPYASWVRTAGVLWDHFFSFDSAIYEQMPADAHGHIHVLPFGINPDQYESVSLNNDERTHYSCDVCFIGAPYPDRVKFLEKIKDLDVKIWGWSGWNKTSLRDRYFGPLDAQESAKAYRAAKVCINTNIHPLANGVNIKTFEICAAGGFQLTDHPTDLSQAFIIGRELDAFEDEREFRQKIDYWLAHDRERSLVAAAGHARTLRDHTLRQRLGVLIKTVGL